MKRIITATAFIALTIASCTKNCQDCVIRENDGNGNISETPVKVCEGEPAPAAADCTI